MSGLNGPTRSLSSYRGRPLIVNVWASWCGPCRAEAASLERLAWSEAGSRYVVIGVSTDDDRNAALKWLRHSNATVIHYIDSRLTLEHMLGASSIPLTVLVDAGGRVVARFYGARQWDTVESIRVIERAFAGARPTPKRQASVGPSAPAAFTSSGDEHDQDDPAGRDHRGAAAGARGVRLHL
jgi:thiol-disulfide isomerase/thioredoxin